MSISQNIAQIELASEQQRKATFINALVTGLCFLHGFVLLSLVSPVCYTDLRRSVAALAVA